jgi:hypothetical protein
VAFGNHLRADENIDLAITKTSENTLEVTDVTHRIPIHTTDAGIWIKLRQIMLEAFRSLPHVMDVFAIALRTTGRGAPGQTTVVA